MLAFTDTDYLTIIAFGLIFICGVIAGWSPTMRELRTTLVGFREISEVNEEPEYQWGDWFVNFEGREVQLPEECPDGFKMNPVDWVKMHKRLSEYD
jgi:hypothetical protein